MASSEMAWQLRNENKLQIWVYIYIYMYIVSFLHSYQGVSSDFCSVSSNEFQILVVAAEFTRFAYIANLFKASNKGRGTW
jgi:hypothetical protein